MKFGHQCCLTFRYTATFIALALTACANSPSRNPYEQYEAVLNAPTQVVYNDKQAIKGAVAMSLQPAFTLKSEITPSDPTIQQSNIQSNYKIFLLQGNKHSQYTIELRSLCACWGLDKFILYPVARILDRYGNIVNDNPASISLSGPDWNYPVNIRMVWEGEFKESGPYYFLVSAYNNRIGAAYMTYTEFDFLSSQILKVPLATAYLELLNSAGNRSKETRDPSKHPLWSSPTGKIVVTLYIHPE